VDTVLLARNKCPGSQKSLDALCKRFRIDNSKRVQHTALIDCDLLAKVYINLIDQKEPTLDFKDKEEEVSKLNTGNVIYSTKVIKPSPEELKNHQTYLKTFLKKNYF
jgi:DNA polymerase-3 subunit epsilon